MPATRRPNRSAPVARPEDAVDAVVFAAGAGDVDTVVAGGEVIVRDGRHVYVDVPGELARALP